MNILIEFKSNKTRIILTILALAWACFSISIMLAIGQGLRHSFAKITQAGSGHHLLIVASGSTSKSFKGIPRDWPVILNKQDFKNLINADIKGVNAILPEYSFNPKIGFHHHHHHKSHFSQQVNGITPQYNFVRNLNVKQGRLINKNDIRHQARVAVIGSKVASKMFQNKKPVGKIIFIDNIPFTIIGVLKDKVSIFNYQTPDNYLIFIPATTYKQFANVNPLSITDFVVQIKDPKKLTQITNQIQKIIALNHGVSPKDSSIINTTNNITSLGSLNKFFFGFEIFLGIIGSFTLLVAAVGIANVMFITVKRKTREIGIRMSLGAKPYQILKHYLFEAFVVTLIGGVLGILLTLVVIFLIGLIPEHGAFFLAVGQIEPVLSWQVFLFVIACLGLTGFFAGIIPAKRAAEINPAVALRNE